MLPAIFNYGQGRSKQHNTIAVVVGGVTIYFSYETPVAFMAPGIKLVVRENDWGPTTGKHLNWIDGGSPDRKAERVGGERFKTLLAEAVK